MLITKNIVKFHISEKFRNKSEIHIQTPSLQMPIYIHISHLYRKGRNLADESTDSTKSACRLNTTYEMKYICYLYISLLYVLLLLLIYNRTAYVFIWF